MSTARLGPDDVDEAVAILRRGGLVALPSETVYGLAARGLDDECVRGIFRAKGRPQDNPVILHVASTQDALPLWSVDADVKGRLRLLADAFWPGPLTLVAHKSALVPDVVTAGLPKVAVRVPAHDAFVRVLSALGEPLAAPSANASSRPSPTTAADVLASLDGKIDAVLDGGPCRFGIESTVVDVSEGVRILRMGAVSAAEIRAFFPDVAVGGGASASSPGLLHRHYVPDGKRVRLVDDVSAAWGADALLVRASTAARFPARSGVEVLPDDAIGYARGLYAALYRIERSAAVDVVIEAVPAGEAWDAVRDRLRRASQEDR